MLIEDKLEGACRALGRLENCGRKLNSRRRRRANYWLKQIDRLERKRDRAFLSELWGSIIEALETGKIQNLTINTP